MHSDSIAPRQPISNTPSQSAQALAMKKTQIADIYRNHKSKESEIISDLLQRLTHPISGKGDLQSILHKFDLLVKTSTEFALGDDPSMAEPTGTGVDKIIAKIQELMSDGINSFGEIGQILRLIALAGGSIPPSLVTQIRQDIKEFLSESLNSGNAMDAVKLLQQIRQMGGSGPTQEILREVERMIEAFLEDQEAATRSDMMSHLAFIAAGKLEQQMDSMLGQIDDTIGR